MIIFQHAYCIGIHVQEKKYLCFQEFSVLLISGIQLQSKLQFSSINGYFWVADWQKMHILRERSLAHILNWKNSHYKGCTVSLFMLFLVSCLCWMLAMKPGGLRPSHGSNAWSDNAKLKPISYFNISSLMTSLHDPSSKACSISTTTWFLQNRESNLYYHLSW